MAQQQLVAHRVGQQLVPALPDNLAAQFGQWAINYVRNNPQDVQEFVRQTTTWIRDNAPNMREQGWHLAQSMRERIREMTLPEAIITAGGAGSGLILGGPAGLIPGAIAGSELGRGIVNNADAIGERFGIENGQGQDSQGNLPDLGGLIPGNSMDNASGGKRPAAGPPAGEPEAQRVAAASSGPGGSPTKETPISPYPSLPYGLQESHTCICPWQGYFSVTGVDYASPVVLELRLTQANDIFKTNLTTVAEGAAYSKGIHNVPFNTAFNRSAATASTFPSTLTDGAFTGELPAWFAYFADIYEYYTVLSCEYKVVIDNPQDSNGCGVLVGYDMNAYSTAAGASGNITPQNQSLNVMQQYKYMNWVLAHDRTWDNEGESHKVISGTYKPGMAKRNIQNDSEVKLWHKTKNPTAPESVTLLELLTLYFFRDELSWQKATDKALGVNCKVSMKYIIQFKDLRQNARYPNTTDTDIVQTIDTDALQVPA